MYLLGLRALGHEVLYIEDTGECVYDPERDEVKRVESGVWLSEGKTGPSRIRVKKRGRHISRLELTLSEGRNRELRRIFAKLGHPVLSLKRIRIGGLTGKGLRTGQWRKLSRAEIRDLKGMARKN